MTKNTGLQVRLDLTTFFKATALGMALALLIEASVRFGLYFLAMRNSLSSSHLLFLASGIEPIGSIPEG